MTNEKMREEFEEWLVNTKRYNKLGKCPLSGNYFSPYLRRMWEAWQASRDSLNINKIVADKIDEFRSVTLRRVCLSHGWDTDSSAYIVDGMLAKYESDLRGSE